MATSMELKIDRRRFVIAGTAGVVGLSAFASSAFAEENTAAVQGLVGYWYGSENLKRISDWVKPELEEPMDVMSAHDIFQADPRFVRTGARVSLYGMPPDVSARYTEIDITALFPVDGEMLPFHAWSMRRHRRMTSPPVQFTVSVDQNSSILLQMDLVESRRGRGARPGGGTPTAPEKTSVQFQVSLADNGPAKVMRGVYFLAVSDQPVDWNGIDFLPSGGSEQRRMLYESVFGERRPVRFPYAIMAIDHAKLDGVGI